ncbi:MAG: alpha/beta fold hydrolase [Planctomycetota bacterium]
MVESESNPKPAAKNRSKRKRLLRWFAFSLAAFMGFTGIAAWVVAGSIVAPRPRPAGDPPPGLGARSVEFESDSGAKIAGWVTSPDGPRGVLLLLHGIHGSRRSMVPRAIQFHDAGYATVLIDLRCHGESSGDRITLGDREREDVRAAVTFTKQVYPDLPLGIVGVSLGGAATLMASPLPFDALVLESVYPDIDRAVRNRVSARLGVLSELVAPLLLWQLGPRLDVSRDELRPIDRISSVGAPVFIISGEEDLHTTKGETRELYDAAAEPKRLWLIESAGHEDLFRVAPDEYSERVIDFFDRHLK